VQIEELRREKPTEVSEGLYALSCGPDTRDRSVQLAVLMESGIALLTARNPCVHRTVVS
jgi:hypothetical protein